MCPSNITENLSEDIFIFPTSFTQERLWLMAQFTEENSAYYSSFAFHLQGSLQVPFLEQALQEIARRHEILRTGFVVIEERPMQAVSETVSLPLSLIDLQSLSESEQASEIKRLIQAEEDNRFKLSQGPLLRVKLLKLSPQSHLLLILMHHLITDGWSISILIEELSALYQAYCEHQPSPLAPLNIQYGDFAEWQRQCFTKEFLAPHLQYWQQKLAGAPPLIELPTDYPRPRLQTFQGAYNYIELPSELVSNLKTFSIHQKTTLFGTFLSALKILLFKWTRQSDLVVGTVVAGRDRAEIEPLIGCFMNFLALRSSLEPEQTILSVCEQEKQVVLDAYSHQDCPFEKVVEVINPERNLGYNPIYNVGLLLQNYPQPVDVNNQLQIEQRWLEHQSATLDLRFVVYEDSQTTYLYGEYRTDLFEAETIHRLLQYFQTVLEQMIANPQQSLAELSILSETERHKLLVEWNDTVREYPQEKCIHQLFEEQVTKTPDAIAVVYEDQQLTYQQLNQKANQLAHYLQKLGVKPDTLVGICVERSLEMVIGLLGILKAEGAYVPIDPEYPKERLSYLLSDAQVEILLTQEKWLKILPSTSALIFCLDRDQQEFAQNTNINPSSKVTQDHLAYMIYTSGSTGKPKGAMNNHKGVVNRLVWMQQSYQLTPSDRVLQKTPFSFDVSVWEFFWTLSTGARLIMAQPGGHKDSSYLIELIRTQGITTTHFVPSMLRIFLQDPDIFNCRSLKRVFCSGEALPFELQERFFESLECELHNLYGPTEAAIDVSYWHCQPHHSLKKVPIGRPVANTQLYILDQNLQPVPRGTPGELHIGGVQVGRGYWQRPELTAEKFITNPFGEGKLYKTGDLCRYLADGNIDYIGRIDNQVKIRGFRIELGEIESILRERPEVEETVVTIKESHLGNAEIIAYVVANLDNQKLDENPSLATSEVEQVEQWEQVFDHTYTQSKSIQELTLNIAGWNDSYTGEPIPENQMREWVEMTVRRILAQHPQSVLEIGSGTGMLLFRIAPHCSYYCGLDISQKAIDYTRRQIQQLEGDWSHVVLHRKSAHELADLPMDKVDAIVINSVVQLFPSIDYLVGVIEQAVEYVSPGGFIFLGDIRNLQLLETLYIAVQCAQASPTLLRQTLLQRLPQLMMQEEELLISPEFFLALKQHLPQISRVQIELKRGYAHNELTQFRYDVILHVGPEIFPPQKQIQTIDWQEKSLSVDSLRNYLLEQQPEICCIRNVPNPRLQEAVNLEKLIKNAKDTETIEEIKAKLAHLNLREGIEPEALWSLGQETNLAYDVSIGWSEENSKDCYDVILQQKTQADTCPIYLPLETSTTLSKSWKSYSNNLLQRKLTNQFILDTKSFLAQQLPDYMVPNAIVLLDALPLTPNGKLDRKALPSPERYERVVEKELISPRNETEKIIAEIWQEILGVRVSIFDNFFELGGNSLLATQVISQISRKFQIKISLQLIFEKSTVAQLGEQIDTIKLASAIQQSNLHQNSEREEIEL